MQDRLVRKTDDKMIAGVCGGLAEYVGVDVTLMRLAFLFLFFASGIGVVIYIMLAVIVPSEGREGGGSIEENIQELTETLSDQVNAIPDEQRSPLIFAGLMIMAGLYFLLNNFGVRIDLDFVWPLMLIGFGGWMLIKRRK